MLSFGIKKNHTESRIEADRQLLQSKLTENEQLRRSELAARQEAEALRVRLRQYQAKANAWDNLVRTTALPASNLPNRDYDSETRHTYTKIAKQFVNNLERAGIPCSGMRWIIDQANDYTVRLFTHVNESRANHALWMNRANRLTAAERPVEH